MTKARRVAVYIYTVKAWHIARDMAWAWNMSQVERGKECNNLPCLRVEVLRYYITVGGRTRFPVPLFELWWYQGRFLSCNALCVLFVLFVERHMM
jgi:hypothetical protein